MEKTGNFDTQSVDLLLLVNNVTCSLVKINSKISAETYVFVMNVSNKKLSKLDKTTNTKNICVLAGKIPGKQ